MDIDHIRRQFPVLRKDRPPVYLDSACMALKPMCVIEAINDYYYNYPACGGRAVHSMATEVSSRVSSARERVARFINAEMQEEIVFLRNTTEAINLVARSFPFKKGDTVLTTDKEHNSNLVPWLALKERGIKHKAVPSTEDGHVDIEIFKSVIEKEKNVRMVALAHIFNLDGVASPVKEITEIAHDAGAAVMVDGAQAVPHLRVDMKKLNCEYYAFSGHKMCGPTGIGVLYGKREALEALSPIDLTLGGETVSTTTLESFDLLPPPARFEGGLQDYAGIMGLHAACDFLEKVGFDNIAATEKRLNKILDDGIKEIPEITIIGPEDPKERGGITNFFIEGVEAHDIALLLSETRSVMVRSGRHCVHSWYNERGKNRREKSSIRASLYLYNNENDVRIFLEGLREGVELFRG